jgi:predicted RNase H-like HicB family nuclease
MSKKSKKSAARASKALPLDRPFDPTVEARAKEIAAGYGIVVRPEPRLGFMARGLEMPYVFADGKTMQDCVRSIREALEVAVATMLEMGDTPPAPADEQRRQEQINIRVTSEEKLLLEEAARSRGFRGVSDFVRSATLSSVK